MVFLDREHRPLSQSAIWDWQRRYFDEQGIRAWSDAVVPQYITSNPWIATAYAHVVAGWLRDLGDTLDAGEPLNVIELGCGSGRFGALFARKLPELAPDVRTRYVYTDFTEYNLDILRSHPSLQRGVDEGQIDFARFDVENDRELRLTHSGDVLGGGTARNPMIVIANYVFDGIRSDCFRVTADGTLEEVLVRAQRDDEDGPFTFSREPRPAADAVYDDPLWNGILDSYRRTFAGTDLLFPRAALTSLRHLHEISGGRLLLISGDKGYVHEDSLRDGMEPQLSMHGSFSMMVNYHAVGQWVAAAEGRFLHTAHRVSALQVIAAVFDDRRRGPWRETELAFGEWIERRAPGDFFELKRAVQTNYETFTLPQLISLIRLSEWDHVVFLGAMTAIMARVENVTTAERAELAAVARNVWSTYFPIREQVDVAFYAALLLLAVDEAAEAIAMFEESIRWYGPDAATSMNLAVCYRVLGRIPEALEHAREALQSDSKMETALTLVKEIESLRL